MTLDITTAAQHDELSVPGVSELLVDALKSMGVKKLTPVQIQCLPHCNAGMDVMAKAKTGTGKTLAFLIPTVHRLMKDSTIPKVAGVDPIRALVLSSTRELAAQIVAQAEKLVQFLPSFNIECILGGSSIVPQRERLDPNSNGQFKYGGVVDIMVATPGRLIEHIETTSGFEARLAGIEVLILDEVDQLLDGGFQKNIEVIISKITELRQTLCFSATVPEKIVTVLNMALKPDHVLIDCVGPEDVATHAKIEQMYIVHKLEQSLLSLYLCIQKEMERCPNDYKILAFLPTARQTQFSAALLAKMGLSVLEIHSRVKQNERNRVSDLFRHSTQVVLLSSDVSARGVDYPDVSLVLQVGAPTTKEVYVQRLGRTGRAGKTGLGVLLLGEYESGFLQQLNGLPVSQIPLAEHSPSLAAKVSETAALLDDDMATQTYRAWIMSMNGMRKVFKWSKQDLVNNANLFASVVLGRGDKLPPINRDLIKTLGLLGLEGLNIVDDELATSASELSLSSIAIEPEEVMMEVAIKVNKKEIGTALKKDAKDFLDALQSLTESDALTLQETLDATGQATVSSFTVLPTWVSVRSQPKGMPKSSSSSSVASLASVTSTDSNSDNLSTLKVFSKLSLRPIGSKMSLNTMTSGNLAKNDSTYSLCSIGEETPPPSTVSINKPDKAQVQAAFERVNEAGAQLGEATRLAKGNKQDPGFLLATENLKLAREEHKQLQKLAL